MKQATITFYENTETGECTVSDSTGTFDDYSSDSHSQAADEAESMIAHLEAEGYQVALDIR